VGAAPAARTAVAAAVATLATAVLVALTTTGVLPRPTEDGPETTFTVLNRTGAPLFHDGIRMQRGGGLGLPIEGCRTDDLVVQDKTGRELGRLDRWCGGQSWTVLGPARSRLARRP